MLCDGGMAYTLKSHVRDELTKLRHDDRAIDLVYISHVDNDHISGILQLLEDEAEWRVFKLHEDSDDPIREPKVPRPPEIKGILHNAFKDQVKENNKIIQNLLSASAPMLYATGVPDLMHMADEMQGIATGIPEALKVSSLISADALDIPLNKPPGVGKQRQLLLAGQKGETFKLGSMKFTLIGPTKKELRDLAEGWKNWLKEKKTTDLKKVRAEIKKRIDDFSTGALTTSPYELDWFGVPDLDHVTAPNVASLMFMVEEDGKTLLLTGDGHPDIILDGLRRTGFLGTSLHLDVLKVQHHGSEHNMHAAFARQVSADHYVFCGNGLHGNPDKSVIDFVYESRMGAAAVRTLSPKAKDRDFHFWFSTTAAAAAPGLKRRDVLLDREKHYKKLAQDSGGRLTLHFNEDVFTTLVI